MSAKPVIFVLLGVVAAACGYVAWNRLDPRSAQPSPAASTSAAAPSMDSSSAAAPEPAFSKPQASMSPAARALSPEQLASIKASDAFYQKAHARAAKQRIPTEEVTIPNPGARISADLTGSRATGYVRQEPHAPVAGHPGMAIPSTKDGPPPGPASAAALASEEEAAIPSKEAIKKPLSLEAWDAESLGLSPMQQQAMENLRSDFIEDIGGPGQDATDPEYVRRWIQSQAKNDQRVRLLLGTHVADMMQTEAARAAYAAQREPREQ